MPHHKLGIKEADAARGRWRKSAHLHTFWEHFDTSLGEFPSQETLRPRNVCVVIISGAKHPHTPADCQHNLGLPGGTWLAPIT